MKSAACWVWSIEWTSNARSQLCHPVVARCSCCTISRGREHREIAEALGVSDGTSEVSVAQGPPAFADHPTAPHAASGR
jgi:hypothetical protein